uniref:Secreted protein n=1 Tax=Candidatus Kentrum sp. LPFa TaxID=2126335 RepID=A0A450Y1Q9_9GAMM|nr:MAG: hypothetical protein BECKLPF1236C_GA0070990_103785 [Candidatus Kentron sp. LPFa]
MKKLLKGSLVAAFLVLGMWAAQASAGECPCPPNSVPAGACEPDLWPDYSVGCSPGQFRSECCAQE